MGSTSERQYELILMGATGYTGKLCAEYITKNLPTDLKWAIAGRNEKKLSNIVEELKKLNPDRVQPGVEVAELKKADLDPLVRKTSLLITTVGPYNLYGKHAFEACAENGTHYIDCTGEVPWYREMIGKYHVTAEKSGAIMIPQAGLDSAPADMMAWMTAKHIREKLSVGTSEIINSIQGIKSGISGGTLSTILTLLDTYPVSYVQSSRDPYSISPVSQPANTVNPRPGWLTTLFGIRNDPVLGTLTDSPQAAANEPMVLRSWGLLGSQLYGDRFVFSDWMRAKSVVRGVAWHFAMTVAMISLAFKPIRMLLKRLVTQPGSGPDLENTKSDFVYYRAIGYADEPSRRRADCTFKFSGACMYYCTALLMAEAAMVIIRGQPTEAHKLRGVVTPATLGDQYVERMKDAGIQLDVKMMD